MKIVFYLNFFTTQTIVIHTHTNYPITTTTTLTEITKQTMTIKLQKHVNQLNMHNLYV